MAGLQQCSQINSLEAAREIIYILMKPLLPWHSACQSQKLSHCLSWQMYCLRKLSPLFLLILLKKKKKNVPGYKKLWASLVSQMAKNLPTMQETWVPSLGWEDPLEEGMATPSSILA